jgi:hypothetical protein
LATSSACKRAGKSFAAHVASTACVSSSVIRQLHQSMRILQATLPGGAHASACAPASREPASHSKVCPPLSPPFLWKRPFVHQPMVFLSCKPAFHLPLTLARDNPGQGSGECPPFHRNVRSSAEVDKGGTRTFSALGTSKCHRELI